MALRNVLKRLTTPVTDLDVERLRAFCASQPDVTPIADLQPRVPGSIVGEITSLRIVPRLDGSPSLEATISDGTGSIVVVWTGRRSLPGVAPGKRLVVAGRGAPSGPRQRLLFYNPRYELL